MSNAGAKVRGEEAVAASRRSEVDAVRELVGAIRVKIMGGTLLSLASFALGLTLLWSKSPIAAGPKEGAVIAGLSAQDVAGYGFLLGAMLYMAALMAKSRRLQSILKGRASEAQSSERTLAS